ncbi:MAG: ABC transporter permease [Candidatus Paraimprobicoccus trichonymphae]|uniref:ABC transporter permease n=1 Tax=Candidatus Paraimprobicoccus trichonymphae TaxID=3033793 RepID=A0AA48I3Z5_9FIRM|nr:MAG: ABC transporter permease [Candidatus Paraimprobicoccus trichonymphae]
MTAIFKRELGSYFNSISGYIFIAVIYFFSGMFFFQGTIMQNKADLNMVFEILFFFVIFLIPILTMRLLSEEKRMKTDQALLTAPIGPWSIVLGKYFSALAIYTMGISVTLIYSIIIAFYATPNWVEIIGNFIGLFITGAALIAIGLFLSSLTESQVISAITSYVASFLILITDGIAQGIFAGKDLAYEIVSYLSFYKHYKSFTTGLLNLADIVFFLSVCGLFLFLTTRTLERKKWN